MRDTIYLDPDLFMALGFSAEAHGGIGRRAVADRDGVPLCPLGHSAWLEGHDLYPNQGYVMGTMLASQGIVFRNDRSLPANARVPSLNGSASSAWTCCRGGLSPRVRRPPNDVVRGSNDQRTNGSRTRNAGCTD